VPDATSIPALPLTGLEAVSETSTPDASDIAALTRRLAAAEDAAFREFHGRYFDRLYRFLLVVTRGQEHAAQDALQETMLRVARYAREFEDEDIFWSWLKAVARNAARDGGRKRRRYLAVLEKFAFWRRDASGSGIDPREEGALRSLIDEGLASLAPLDRHLIEGKYLRGYTVVELATDTGLTEKAVESRLVRSRRQLAEAALETLRKR
jgi:RNA polymerase sigma-70 factor (ECF subfamily)